MIFTRERRRQYIRRAAFASTAAAVAGYVAGLLTAPQSGKETRQDIKKAADKGRSQAEKDLKKAQAELETAIDAAKQSSAKLSKKAQQELNDAIDKAKDSRDKGKTVLAAIRSGEAEDKDLQRAVKNANTSLRSLRKYLKK